MKVEVEIVSRESIKPSSPTPAHLQNYQLSFLDQISPPIYMPFIFFYEPNLDNELSNTDKSNLLKLSLSKTLTHFYPLAGRLIDSISVDCNDEGITYSEARAKCQISQVVQDQVANDFTKFLPLEVDDVGNSLMAVQVNFFNCGGMAVGISTSHIIADSLSIAMFVNSWAAIARGDSSSILFPLFESAKLFPPRNISDYKPNPEIPKDKFVMKSFVFSNSMVAALRDKYTDRTDEDCFIRPTRVEALSAFIWNRFSAATKVRLYTVFHAVNLRTKMDPPLPDCSFGNIISRIAIATPFMDNGNECRDLVRHMKATMKDIDGDYVTKLQEVDEQFNLLIERAPRITKGEVVMFNFSSLCTIPLYEVDFGWGRPVRVGLTNLMSKNFVIFMDNREGDGIEAWMNMGEGDVAKFEVDKEFLAYTCPRSTSTQITNKPGGLRSSM